MNARVIPHLPLLLMLLPSLAQAWDSTCFVYPDPTLDRAALRTQGGTPCAAEPGPYAARGRMIQGGDALDEHGAIFRAALRSAGIPAAVLATQVIRVFTDERAVPSRLVADMKSVAPVDFTQTQRVVRRAFAVDEMAMLPDFSYSLSDWVNGNETCPWRGYEGESAVDCHTFLTHMGAANANHFPPQAGLTYTRLHEVAVGRAAACARLRGSLGENASKFRSYLQECEIEAITIEAVAQHYLQDSWSSGHMWERWGPADVDLFPDMSAIPALFKLGSARDGRGYKRYLARVVAAMAGLVHGMEPLLSSFPDALCHPYEDIQYRTQGSAGTDAMSAPVHGVGDLYLHTALGANALTTQGRSLLACASSSVLQVYNALGDQPTFGPANPVASLFEGLPLVTPADCLDQRATNRAMYHGVGIDTKFGLIRPDDLGSEWFIVPVVPFIVGQATNLGPVGINMLNRDYIRLGVEAARLAKDPASAQQTDIANLETTSGGAPLELRMMSVARNRAYLSPLLASYQDPALPWPDSVDNLTPNAAGRALSLARFFNRSHAPDWCARMQASDLEALRSRVRALGLSDAARPAACEACTEMVSRQVRSGRGAGDYDNHVKALCEYVPETKEFVYQSATGSNVTPDALAAAWCGCGCPSLPSGDRDPTSIALKSFSIMPSMIAGGASFTVQWTAESLAYQYGTFEFFVNNVESVEPGFVSGLPPGLSGSAFTRVFAESTLPQTGQTVADDRSRSCQRITSADGSDSFICLPSGGLKLLLPTNGSVYGILRACVPCASDANVSTCDMRATPLMLAPRP